MKDFTYVNIKTSLQGRPSCLLEVITTKGETFCFTLTKTGEVLLVFWADAQKTMKVSLVPIDIRGSFNWIDSHIADTTGHSDEPLSIGSKFCFKFPCDHSEWVEGTVEFMRYIEM